MRIISLQDKKYAVGLWWQLREGPVASRRKMLLQARETAKTLTDAAYDCVLVRKHQFGLGAVGGSGGIPRVPALAVSLRCPDVPFLGVFRLPADDLALEGEELWWVCGIAKGGVVFGDGDELHASREAAEKSAQSLRTLLGEVGADVLCAAPEETSAYLGPLLRSPDARLERLYPDPRRNRRRLWAALALVAVLGGVMGWNHWRNWTEEQAHLENARRLQGEQAQRLRDARADPGRYFEKTWLKAPPASAVAAHCLPSLLLMPSGEHGWRLRGVSCNATGIVQEWEKQRVAGYVVLPEHAALSPGDPRKALGRIPLAPIGRRDAPGEALLPKARASGHLYQLIQNLGNAARGGVKWDAPKVAHEGKLEIVCPWIKGKWEISGVPASAMLDQGLFEALDAVPALTLESITLQNATWSIKGSVYATP